MTLGCRLNQYDTAAMRARALAQGFVEAEPDAAADAVLINTCTVTARADRESRQWIHRIHRSMPLARIVVTGCYAERARQELAGIPGVSAVLGVADREDADTLLGALGGLAPGRPARSEAPATRPPAVGPRAERPPAVGPRAIREFRTGAPAFTGRSRALLKIQDGCDSFCTYCVVPYVRGRSRSLPLAEALERARRLVEAGFHEIVLTGADLGSYGRDLGHPRLLAKLIAALLSLGGGHRIRLSSIEPNKLDPAVEALVGSEPRLCRHLHLPLQSGSNAILRSMRRGYSRESYRALLDRLTARGPVGIGTDVIVGYPGEDEAMFEETRRFLEDAPLTYFHVFRYSARPGTAAARLHPGPPDPGSEARSAALRTLGEAKAEAFRRSLIGSTLSVVRERGHGERGPLAMSDLYVAVELTHTPPGRGILPVRIVGAQGKRLVGAP
ncbi:MAG: tRNA (N(6)-L-threonylcarbamoyladenosine(37)-C(2))-methylthiotransferase MtaB [Candidatus Latescibacteria bacterium]|nr:tRNA (N(6)-L-threonylcarbamoyladenosine(37)-C(2))-methylthiotransferase MtaB [Candidatus Latescibacterota bacterium]